MSLKDDIDEMELDSLVSNRPAWKRLRARLKAAEKEAALLRAQANAGPQVTYSKLAMRAMADRLSPPDQQQPKTEEAVCEICGQVPPSHDLHPNGTGTGSSTAAGVTRLTMAMTDIDDGCSAVLEPNIYGAYVRYTDYAAKAEECERLKRAVNDMRERLRMIREFSACELSYPGVPNG